ncbi:TfoX/Sxy family DNA transformation protein [Rhodobacter capsulatus]|uniref:TfoX/Sxy family DNA transformation protein n=1 Tax=Rhodobacter capsulatus TaxID=1061 RepID=UPI0040277C46
MKSPMTSPLTDIPGIGPATAEGFLRSGITSAEALRAMGADAAYEAWLRGGNPPHFIGYYALVMALQGRPWNDCRGAEKDALRVKFDALKARALGNQKGHPGIEAALDLIGVGLRR